MTGLLAAALAAACCAASASAQQGGAVAGRMLFHTYCASCHGADARGDGPVAITLETPPADLTRLSERYGTPLPREQLARFIDGRQDVIAHGPREMPVWGRRLFEEPPRPPNREAAKRQAIELLVDYLETLQPERSASRGPGGEGRRLRPQRPPG